MKMDTKFIGKYFLIICIVSFLFSNFANAQTWKPKGEVANNYINCIYVFGNNDESIAVASDKINTDFAKEEVSDVPYDGNGFQISTDKGANFGDSFLDGYRVFSILQSPNDPAKWYVATRKNTRSYMAVSKDNGENWDYTCDNSYQIMDMTYSDLNKDKILCAATKTSQGFITSEDDFVTCTPEDVNFSSRSIKVSTFDQNLIFMAGDDKQGGVWRTNDGGENWQHSESGLRNLRVLCVMPGGYSMAEVYCGCDSLHSDGSKGMGIYQSLDTGKTWKLVGAEGHRVFDIKMHPTNKQQMAAAGDSSGVWFSGSWGYGWENYSDGLTVGRPVRHIAIPDWSTTNGLQVVCAVYGVGLFQSEPVITSIDESPTYRTNSASIEILRTYPIPFNTNLKVSWYNEKDQFVDVYVVDQLGRNVTTIDNKRFGKGEQMSILNTNGLDLSTGVYMLCIEANGITSSQKIFFDPNK
jgi:Secretion system C-terminal sorting domain